MTVDRSAQPRTDVELREDYRQAALRREIGKRIAYKELPLLKRIRATPPPGWRNR